MSLTPMMKQYLEVKDANKDCLIFYRLGDFYEMFFDDAVTASKELELTLTARDCGLPERAPMCGVPYHAVDGYINKLVSRGYKVAICEQLTEAGKSALVERGIVRIATAGTVIDSTALEEDRNNYVASVSGSAGGFGVAWIDITTGEYNIQELAPDSKLLNDLLLLIRPAEIICDEYVLADSFNLPGVKSEIIPRFSIYKLWAFEPETAQKNVAAHFGDTKRFVGKPNSLNASGALLEFIHDTQKKSLMHLREAAEQEKDDYMRLDYNTMRNLEIIETARDRKKKSSLLWVLDKTRTSVGARLLRKWLENPLTNIDKINFRLSGVEELLGKAVILEELKGFLSYIKDIERISGKISIGNLNPRDCLALKDSLYVIPKVYETIKPLSAAVFSQIKTQFDLMDDVYTLLDGAINEDAPALMKDGGYIKKGFDRRLDEYRGAGGEGKSWIAELEAKERASTGIKTLKIGFNRVFGYYIEVSKSQTQLVPYSYHRKQTIAGGERYITEELKQIEEKILTSEECSVKLEAELFQKTLAVLVLAIPRLQLLASHIAALDVFCSLASVSRENNYSKPVMTDDGGINIIDGRHPAIERLNKNTEFVPNNTLLDNAENRILVITGPNMGGKSTYMRQVALIVFMAHIGCFVPAKSARISITDRIFTRVGASDDLAMGQSTFMVEMIEVAEILKNATSSSLLILDEIGRGTSTLDGLSIAWAVMEYLAVTVNAKALFATHFHELTDLETVLRGVKNYKVSIKELNKNVVFLYKILRGSANKSFGVEVAGLAGLPDSVVARSKELLKLLELHNLKDSALKLSKLSGMQLSLFDYGKDALKLRDEIIDILKAADCNNLTPIAAFELLSDLKTRAKEC